MRALARVLLCAIAMTALAACQPAVPPTTALPTKENTIDKVKDGIDKAMKKAQEIRDAEDSEKKGY